MLRFVLQQCPVNLPASRAGSSARIPCCRLLLLLLLLPLQMLHAASPQPFTTIYDARYGDFKTEASRSLAYDDENHHFVLTSEIKLVILGSAITAINERSEFLWRNEQPLPLSYTFVQSGLGERKRSVEFDHAGAEAFYRVDERSGTLPLTGPVFDELSGYLLLKERLAQGDTDIYFDVVDRDEIRTHHYRVLEKEMLATRLGDIETVRLERVRREQSSRRTEIWLAPRHDYLMVKLLQEEPDGRIISLDVKEAMINGMPVNPG